jgi:glycosyltransferase involved in cell wall biosynthesis
MRILNVSSLYPPNVVGGAELGLKTMSDAMSAAGHDVHVATLAPPPGEGAPVGQDSGDVTVHAVPLANVYWPYRRGGRSPSAAMKLAWHGIDTANETMARRVARIVRRVQPDVVMTRNLQGFSTAVMPAVARTGVPLVHVLHDYALLCPQTTLWRNGRGCGLRSARCTGCKVLTAPRRRHVEAVDAVIGVSRSVLEFHRDHGLFGGVAATVIHNALKPSLSIRERVSARAAGAPFVFGYLGRIERSKGIETLLKAAARLEAGGARFRLLVAGRGDAHYVDELKRRWPLASVEYLGFVDAAEFLARLDTLVFPSEWLEALGNGVFEAMSQGVPVIGAASGGIPESIDDGVTGFVFPPGDVIALSSVMRRLTIAPGLRVWLGTAALKKAEHYRAPRRARQYLTFLDGVIDAHRNGAAA